MFGIEQWRPFPGVPAFLVSSEGRVWSETKEQIIRPSLNHVTHRLYAGGMLLNRAVWIAFHGPIPATWDVHHKNLDPLDNRLDNLEAMHRYEHRPGHPRKPRKAKAEVV